MVVVKILHLNIAIYPGNYKLPKTEEETIKKGLLNYNKIKGGKALTYPEILEILQRDYYYRKYKGDSRIYINNKGRAIEFKISQRGNEHVR
ncbi:hypothetical protein [Leptotrichia sp. OH3620_COT-345]|uniref:hypothetical protein n=1 Tax=Leptotrichia sp. OH3620_COT-345 TaxID=2491048 RepID=UPI0011CF812A|nr:hypothetical protein [Leptotrichia sp. OH3620_COT-345]